MGNLVDIYAAICTYLHFICLIYAIVLFLSGVWLSFLVDYVFDIVNDHPLDCSVVYLTISITWQIDDQTAAKLAFSL